MIIPVLITVLAADPIEPPEREFSVCLPDAGGEGK
jgi:hypothetical protein